MLGTHQRPELLTLCLVSLTPSSSYWNKLNSCTFLIPKGCPIIRGSKQLHSSCRLPQGCRSGGAEGSVNHPLLRDTTNPRSQLLFSASFCISMWDFWCRWPNDWSICHHWRSTLEGGKGFRWMVESTAKFPCETDASLYNSESFEMCLLPLLSVAKMRAESRMWSLS